jgi:hypothetical protein
MPEQPQIPEPSLKVEVKNGTPFDSGVGAILAVQVEPRFCQDFARISILAAFTKVAIPCGHVVRTECYIATTGGFFELHAGDAALREWLRPTQMETQNTISDKQTNVLKVDSKPIALSAQRQSSAESRFNSSEATLVDTQLGHHIIQWSIALHRGAKAVRDYLEGNLHLWAEAGLPQNRMVAFKCTARATDRLFFGPDHRALGRLGSLALYIRLRKSGVPLPEPGTIEYQVTGSWPASF